MKEKTLDEFISLLAKENAELKGAINWTIDNVCSAEDRKAIMELDSYASDCYELTCSLHIMQHEVSLYVRHIKHIYPVYVVIVHIIFTVDAAPLRV